MISQSTIDGSTVQCILLCLYGGTMMGSLPLPICPVNGNIVQSHRSLARTPQTAFQTSHHRHAAYLAIFDLESALSRSPWGS